MEKDSNVEEKLVPFMLQYSQPEMDLSDKTEKDFPGCIESSFGINSIYGLEIDQIVNLGWEETDIIDNERYETIFDNAKIFRKNGFLLRTVYGYLNEKIISSNIVIFNNFGERFFFGECPNKETLIQLETLIKIN